MIYCKHLSIPTLSTSMLIQDNSSTNVHVLSHFSRVRLFATAWTVARQAPLSIVLSQQEYWSGLPFPPPGDLPDPGIKPASPTLAGGFFTPEPPRKPIAKCIWLLRHFPNIKCLDSFHFLI